MKSWLLLAGAIIAEVIGTVSLRAAVENPSWIALLVIAYPVALVLLGLTLRTGKSVGVVYGIWGAAGVALVTLFGAAVFGETLSPQAMLGIAVIIVGMVVVVTGARPRRDAAAGESAP